MNQVLLSYKAIGVMSGTSLDGVDVVACTFTKKKAQWDYKIMYSHTFDYTPKMLQALKESQELSGFNLTFLDVQYGKFTGELVREFCEKYNFQPNFIASHGYTVFHQPNVGLTLQIGSGAHIAACTGVKTICDFRTNDVALDGQGAPLVPIGDELLFNEYDACLNLGGFSNISYNRNQKRIAYDICPVNFVLNALANMLGKDYDAGGEIGRGGSIDKDLLKRLNALSYYKQKPPKSLGREFVEMNILPLINNELSIPDLLRTFYEHVAVQIAKVLNDNSIVSVLITGGGAYNAFLISLIKSKTKTSIVLPESNIIDMKEALVFAFLGLLRLHDIPNCLASVTGARKDNVGGIIYT